MLVVKLICIFSKIIKWQSEHDDKIKIANRDSTMLVRRVYRHIAALKFQPPRYLSVRQVLRTYMYM